MQTSLLLIEPTVLQTPPIDITVDSLKYSQSLFAAIQLNNEQTNFIRARLVALTKKVLATVWKDYTAEQKCHLPELGDFITEMIKKSGTTFSTLILANLYIQRLYISLNNNKSAGVMYAACGRRMFLTALLLATKFIQEPSASNKAWSKISGLPVTEINAMEREFLRHIRYTLHVTDKDYVDWIYFLFQKFENTQSLL